MDVSDVIGGPAVVRVGKKPREAKAAAASRAEFDCKHSTRAAGCGSEFTKFLAKRV